MDLRRELLHHETEETTRHVAEGVPEQRSPAGHEALPHVAEQWLVVDPLVGDVREQETVEAARDGLVPPVEAHGRDVFDPVRTGVEARERERVGIEVGEGDPGTAHSRGDPGQSHAAPEIEHTLPCEARTRQQPLRETDRGGPDIRPVRQVAETLVAREPFAFEEVVHRGRRDQGHLATGRAHVPRPQREPPERAVLHRERHGHDGAFESRDEDGATADPSELPA